MSDPRERIWLTRLFLFLAIAGVVATFVILAVSSNPSHVDLGLYP